MIVAVPLALLGGFVALLNFYLSFVRGALHHWFRREEAYHHISGFPIVGSLFLWIAALIFWLKGHPRLCWASVALSAPDTGGLHWFLWVMFRYEVLKKPYPKQEG